jgi:nucleoid-associated protein YgaU
VTPSKKILIASTLLAVGYGLATLLGAPESRYPTGILRLVGKSTSSNRAVSTVGTFNSVGSVRLLPDESAAYANASRTADPPPTKESVLAAEPPADRGQNQSPAAAAESNQPMPLLDSRLELRATLKDEAPRALPGPAPTRREEQSSENSTAFWQRTAAPTPEEANHVWPAGYTTAGAVVHAPSAEFVPTQPHAPDFARKFTAPPWPMEEEKAVGTHVVVDGDSLARLAGRYLDDPRRGEEIFALNQGVLTDPALLPIGAELKLPDRATTGSGTNSPPKSSPGGGPQLHSASHHGRAPAQPVPITLEVIPRAQLLRPRPVE